MSSHATSTRFRVHGRRTVLGLLALGWLNLTVLPCAMALETALEQAPAQQMAAHHGHHDAGTQPSCATMQSDCCELDVVHADDRNQNAEKRDGYGAALIVASNVSGSVRFVGPAVGHANDPPDLIGGSPRLHVIYCVYLD